MTVLIACADPAQVPPAGSIEPNGTSPAPTGSAETPTSGPIGPIATAALASETAAVREQIEAADLANKQTIDALEGVRFTPAGEEAARAVLASSASGDVLWAATWVYASSATDPAPLVPLLANSDPTIRAMAAATLVALGDGAGFAVLGELLSHDDQLRGSTPATTIAGFAALTLASYVEAADAPAPPVSSADLAAVEELWTIWLHAHPDDLVFDASGSWKTL